MNPVAVAGSRQDEETIVLVVRDVSERERAQREREAAIADAARRKAVVDELQRAFLPQSLPALESHVISARYVAAEPDAPVGGDWYDAFMTPSGALVLAVGDVAGHGVAASGLMSLVRSAIRAYANESESPAEILDRADRLVGTMEGFATCWLASYEPVSGAYTWASAGHPPPVIVARDATRLVDGDVDAPLGLVTRSRADRAGVLATTQSLVVYSDGLVERRDEPLTDGSPAAPRARGRARSDGRGASGPPHRRHARRPRRPRRPVCPGAAAVLRARAGSSSSPAQRLGWISLYWNRRDGRLVSGLPLNRRAMPYIMRTRPESAFYFQYDVRLAKTDAFLCDFNAEYPDTPADVLHVALYALRDVYVRYPTLNRFVAGGRIYDRNEIQLSYSSRHAPVSGAPAATIKRSFDPDETFAAMVADMHDDLHNAVPEAAGVSRVAERLMSTPGITRRVAFGAVHFGNAFGLLPRSYTDGDPLFTSAYFTDLTHTGLPHGYAHLHEHGTCTAVCVLGTPQNRCRRQPGAAGHVHVRRADRGRAGVVVRAEALPARRRGPRARPVWKRAGRCFCRAPIGHDPPVLEQLLRQVGQPGAAR